MFSTCQALVSTREMIISKWKLPRRNDFCMPVANRGDEPTKKTRVASPVFEQVEKRLCDVTER